MRSRTFGGTARVLVIVACLGGGGARLFSQARDSSAAQDRKDPFEAIPPAPTPAVGPGVIEGVDFRGSRRSPQDALRRAVSIKVGDAYSEEAVRRDIMALRNMNRFDEIRVSTEEGKKGGIIVHFVVAERPPGK